MIRTMERGTTIRAPITNNAATTLGSSTDRSMSSSAESSDPRSTDMCVTDGSDDGDGVGGGVTPPFFTD